MVEFRMSDPVLREEHIRTLRGIYVLKLLLRQFSGKGPYAGQRSLQINISSGGGAGTGTPSGTFALFDKGKAQVLIPILEQAREIASGYAEHHHIDKGEVEDHPSFFIELFWAILSFGAEVSLFHAAIPIEFGCHEFRVEVLHNTRRKNLICVLGGNISPLMTMHAVMNYSQFEMCVQHIVQMTEEM